MLKATEIKVIKDGQDVMLGTYDKETCEAANLYGISNRITDTISVNALKDYIMEQNINSLSSIAFAPMNGPQVRNLDPIEISRYDSLMVLFGQAKKTALPQAINRVFSDMGKY